MNFQEFLARKRALALVEHMNTLSESDAQELFDSLDEETVEFVEAVLNEGSRGIRRAERRMKPYIKQHYSKFGLISPSRSEDEIRNFAGDQIEKGRTPEEKIAIADRLIGTQMAADKTFGKDVVSVNPARQQVKMRKDPETGEILTDPLYAKIDTAVKRHHERFAEFGRRVERGAQRIRKKSEDPKAFDYMFNAMKDAAQNRSNPYNIHALKHAASMATPKPSTRSGDSDTYGRRPGETTKDAMLRMAAERKKR